MFHDALWGFVPNFCVEANQKNFTRKSFNFSSKKVVVEKIFVEKFHKKLFFTVGMYKAVIIGATGAVGGNILKELLRSPKCVSITSLGRRKVDLSPEWRESLFFIKRDSYFLQRRLPKS